MKRGLLTLAVMATIAWPVWLACEYCLQKVELRRIAARAREIRGVQVGYDLDRRGCKPDWDDGREREIRERLRRMKRDGVVFLPE